MSQTVAIVLHIESKHSTDFEVMFEQEVLPLWHRFKDSGKLIAASLTPVEDGDDVGEEGVTDYLLHVEVPGMEEHNAFDSDPEFLKFLPKAQPMQPKPPRVAFGTTRFSV
jgi:hypothetical protein